jgi:hypothetical protein
LGVGGGLLEGVRDGVVEDGLRDAIDCARAIEGSDVRVDLAIAGNVWTSRPSCTPKTAHVLSYNDWAGM